MNNFKFDVTKKMDLIAVGRACLDLNPVEINRPMEESVTFKKYVGGSPANISIAAARLNLKAGFIGRVSNDQHGRYIKGYLQKAGVDTKYVITDQSGSVSGLAFLEVKSPSDCSIVMYRDNAADLKLEPKDIDESYIADSKILLISGTALAASPSREAVFVALEYAKRNNTIVFFDIDYRPYTWNSDDETAVYYSLAAEKSDIVIGTREEFDMLEKYSNPNNKDDEKTAGKLFSHGAQLVIVKHGKQGSYAFTPNGEKITGRVFPVTPLKTFGAGDSYAGGLIFGLLTGKSIDESMAIGAASAAIVVSSDNCSEAMPTYDQILEFMKNYKGQEGS